MTYFLIAMAALWLVTLVAYSWLLSRYKALASPTRTLTIRYASGRLPKAPFEYHAGAVRAVVVRVDPIGDGQAIAILRDRRWTDRVRFGLGELRYRIADRLTPGSHDGK